MSVNIMHKMFVFTICISPSCFDISVNFQKGTKFDFSRETTIHPLIVRSITDCAMQCLRKTRCVLFFYNHFDSLCQVEGHVYMSFDKSNTYPWAYYEMKMTNVAALKPVTMSSEWNPPYHLPQYAVDDQVVNTMYGEQCAHTINDATPWLTIDLENTFDVHYVTLFNRVDALGERLHGISVDLGNDHMSGPFPVACGKFEGPGKNAEVVQIVCDEPARGQFVRISMNNFQKNSCLTLCEVRVLV